VPSGLRATGGLANFLIGGAFASAGQPGVAMPGTYLIDYNAHPLTRATPAWEPIGNGYLRVYEPNKIRPHASIPHLYRFESTMTQWCGDNVRGLMSRAFDELSFNTLWTQVNCLPEWFSVIDSRNTPIRERDPVGDQAVQCVVTANGDASLTRACGSIGTVRTVASVYVKLPAGAAAPVNGCQLQVVTNAGATIVTKNITPTSQWVQHSLSYVPVGTANDIVLKLPNATAGDKVMWALPMLINAGRDYNGVNAGWPVIRLGGLSQLSDGDNLVVPMASVPSQILGGGGAFAFDWVPIFDSADSADVTFFSCGELTHEILWAPARDNCIRIRAGTLLPQVKTQVLEFLAGDVITIEVSPTTGKCRVSGCSISGNGLGPASWVDADGAGTAAPYTWPAADMWVGDRFPGGAYTRGSHMGAGYISEPYAVDVF
jgi:hypothetical protein